MSKKPRLVRTIIYMLMAAALMLLYLQYSQLPKGAESLTLLIDGEAAGENVTLHSGAEAHLTYSIQPKSFADRPINWEVTDESVATIDSEGKLTAISEGTTQVSAEAAGCKASFEISVVDPVASIGGFQTDVTVNVGYSYKVEPEIELTSEGAKAPVPIFESDDESIVTVDEEGNITAVGTGTTNVTVKVGKISQKIIVRVGNSVQ